jgi:hypothetical protein
VSNVNRKKSSRKSAQKVHKISKRKISLIDDEEEFQRIPRNSVLCTKNTKAKIASGCRGKIISIQGAGFHWKSRRVLVPKSGYL